VIEAPALGKYSVDIPFPVAMVQGIDGRKIEMHGANLALTDGVAYLWTNVQSIQSMLTRTSGSFEQGAKVGLGRDSTNTESPIVLEAMLDSKTFLNGARGYEISNTTTSIPVKIQISNLSSTVQHILLNVGGVKRIDAYVRPNSLSELTQNVSISDVKFDSDGVALIRVRDELQRPDTTLPSVLRISRALGLNEYLSAYKYNFALPIGDLNRWMKNSSGDMQISISGSGTVQIDEKFKDKNNWAFPWLSLPQEVDLDRITGVLVRARCERQAAVKVMTWANESNANNVTGYPVFRADGEWHIAYVPFTDFIPPSGDRKVGQQVRRISLGLGSSELNNHLEISDLILLGN
jgi:hypothetical protein